MTANAFAKSKMTTLLIITIIHLLALRIANANNLNQPIGNPVITINNYKVYRSLSENLSAIERALSREDLPVDKIHTRVKNFFKLSWQLPANLFTVDVLSNEGLKIINTSFRIRLILNNFLKRASRENKLTKELIADVRNLMRVGRYIEDMTYESKYQNENERELLSAGKLKAKPGFSGDFRNNLINPNFKNDLALKSGDIIAVRGNSFISAAIARLSDVDSNFSHMALVYILPENSSPNKTIEERTFVMESLVETGVNVRSLKEFLNEHAGYRLAVFRLDNDEVTAHKAASWMYNHIYQNEVIQKNKIVYNFSMDLNITDKLFCSQLAYEAYKNGTDGKFQLMIQPSILSPKYRNFFKFIGVTATNTYVPGDIESDPRFTLVREWRDYNFTKALRYRDMTITKFLEWIEKYNFKFSSTALESTIATLAWTWRRIPVANLFIPASIPVPMNQSISSMAMVITLHRSGDLFEKALLEKEKQHLGGVTHQRLKSWTPVEAYSMLEQLRTELKESYSKWMVME